MVNLTPADISDSGWRPGDPGPDRPSPAEALVSGRELEPVLVAASVNLSGAFELLKQLPLVLPEQTVEVRWLRVGE